MTEIKRFDLGEPWTLDGAHLSEDPSGEWVRWEEVEKFVENAYGYKVMEGQLRKLMDSYVEATKVLNQTGAK